MSPKYVDKEQKARKIAQAALDVFSQKGYATASVDQIAVAAGIAKGTVYDYFPSKDKLYVAALNVFVEESEKVITNKLSAIQDPFLRLVEFVTFSIEFSTHQNSTSVRTMFDILQQSMLENGVLYKRKYLVQEFIISFRRILIDILLDGVSQGIFFPEIARDAEKLATNIIAFLDGASLHRLITENYFKMPEQLTHGMQFLAGFILVTPNDYDVDALIAQAIGR